MATGLNEKLLTLATLRKRKENVSSELRFRAKTEARVFLLGRNFGLRGTRERFFLYFVLEHFQIVNGTTEPGETVEKRNHLVTLQLEIAYMRRGEQDLNLKIIVLTLIVYSPERLQSNLSIVGKF